MRCAVLCLSLALIATGCQKTQDEKHATHVAQKSARPVVALVPLYDRTANHDVSWNLSEELTRGIGRKLMEHENFYLVSDQQVRAIAQKMQQHRDPFAAEISWMKRLFRGSEFVIFTELLEHEEVSVSHAKGLDSPAIFNISMKVRVVDLRGDKPLIVLQEILHHSQELPKQFTRANFRQIAWGQDDYHMTPIAIAHTALIKEAVDHIEDYILLTAK